MLTNGLSAAHAGSVTAHYIRVTLAKSRGPMNKQDVGTNCFTDRPICKCRSVNIYLGHRHPRIRSGFFPRKLALDKCNFLNVFFARLWMKIIIRCTVELSIKHAMSATVHSFVFE